MFEFNKRETMMYEMKGNTRDIYQIQNTILQYYVD